LVAVLPPSLEVRRCGWGSVKGRVSTILVSGKCCSNGQTTFLPAPNHIFPSKSAFRALRRETIMALPGEAKKPAAAAKAKPPVPFKHLAAALADEHQLTKRAGEAILGDLVGLITKHLKKGERIRIAGLGSMGRNPGTEEAIQIKASKKVAFRAAKDLKMAV
jgi:DNA-binding protein HU-beta